MSEGNGWKGWALALVTGLLIGGLGGGFIGERAAGQVESRVERRVIQVEVNEQKNFEIIMGMSNRLVRMETMLENLEKEVGR